MKQEIRNTVGKLIGYVITESNGNAAAFDARNLKLGTYEASENKPRDRNNRLIGHGNLLARLIRG